MFGVVNCTPFFVLVRCKGIWVESEWENWCWGKLEVWAEIWHRCEGCERMSWPEIVLGWSSRGSQVWSKGQKLATWLLWVIAKIVGEWGFPYCFCQVALVMNPPANAGDVRDTGLISWVGKIPWRRAWQPTPVFLPGESYGQRSLAGYSP